jgi:hypothetical protein
MLSIQFSTEREWWVSGEVFERLFKKALSTGALPSSLEHWQYVAEANGGLDVGGMEPFEAFQLTSSLRRTAEYEIARMVDSGKALDSDTYFVSLNKLLQNLPEASAPLQT